MSFSTKDVEFMITKDQLLSVFLGNEVELKTTLGEKIVVRAMGSNGDSEHDSGEIEHRYTTACVLSDKFGWGNGELVSTDGNRTFSGKFKLHFHNQEKGLIPLSTLH